PSLLDTDDLACFSHHPQANLKPMSRPSDLAYVIYTSGTTGQPKGVMVEQKGIVNRIDWMQKKYPLNSASRVLQKTPYTFDVSVWETLWANWVGAAIVIAKPESHKEPELLNKLILNAGVTTLHFVPSMLAAYCHYLSQSGLQLPESIEHVFCSGEALTIAQVNEFNKLKRNNTALYNLYGPTEASIDVTYYDNPAAELGMVPIGLPIYNTRVFVLNIFGEPSPTNTPGELLVGGAGLARGYLNQPALTKEKFIDNPFATEADKAKGYTRLYKTGDLVRWLPDGNLEYLGRNDSQVKIRGHRIELGEIESALSQQPDIQQAVVIAKEKEGSQYLAAYFVSNVKVDVEQLRERLAQQLPDYMLPTTFTAIDSIPLTINGKLDKQALPEPELINRDNYTAPRNELEEKLCAIWQNVLGLEQVGIHDHFFRIGGDSIKAIKLINNLNSRLKIDLPMVSLFTHSCIASLSEEIRNFKLSKHILKKLTPTSTSNQTLFMIHPGGSGCEVYQGLASELGDKYNCIGVENFNHKTENRTGELSKIADVYLKAIIDNFSPLNSIRLLGWSMGGNIALEMAYQLEKLGLKNIKVYLLDTVIKTKSMQEFLRDSVYKELEKETLNNGYIDKVTKSLLFEEEISNCALSGILEHTDVILFKAGQIYTEMLDNIEWKGVRGIKIPQNNNIPQFIGKETSIVMIENKNHGNILEAISSIRKFILKNN
ncbi:amino acid adenylation domain-containing protein, partial [Rheinheimera baltica]